MSQEKAKSLEVVEKRHPLFNFNYHRSATADTTDDESAVPTTTKTMSAASTPSRNRKQKQENCSGLASYSPIRWRKRILQRAMASLLWSADVLRCVSSLPTVESIHQLEEGDSQVQLHSIVLRHSDEELETPTIR
uniref:Uncharacterized protein n=1 Tax=Ditylenchus dipsaci TaxID=166011 RepID=A0A915EV63_9BILA